MRRFSGAVVVAPPPGKNIPGPDSRPAPIHPKAVSVAADQLTLGAELLVVVPVAFSANAAAAAAKFGAVDLDALKFKLFGLYPEGRSGLLHD